MKILLDENLPHALRREIPGHDIFTVKFMGWSGMRNGVLLAQAVAAGFVAMITLDNGVAYQQNMAKIELCLVVLSARSSDMDDIRPLLPLLIEALNNVGIRKVVRVG